MRLHARPEPPEVIHNPAKPFLPKGVIFLDRDPKHFQGLLNFLRDGWCLLPQSAEERTELLHEIRFYQVLIGHNDACGAYTSGHMQVERG